MNEEFVWAWAAGIVDGEGTIGLSRIRNTSYTAYLSIEMSHQETIRKLRRLFRSGGTYDRERDEAWSIMYTVQLNGQEAINCVKRLLPYLVTKREQALLLVEYGEKCQMKRGYNKPISEEIDILKEIIYDELKVLNKKGK